MYSLEDYFEIAKRVIDSCQTDPQIEAAESYVSLLSRLPLDRYDMEHLYLRLKAKRIDINRGIVIQEVT
jgi:hypothetical protein